VVKSENYEDRVKLAAQAKIRMRCRSVEEWARIYGVRAEDVLVRLARMKEVQCEEG